MRDFSYQLYSSRKFPPLEETLKMVARLGYKQVEGYGALFDSLDDLGGMRDTLSANGLTMPTGHFGIDLIEEAPNKVVEIAKTLGIETVIVPYLALEDRPEDAAGWAAFGTRLAEAGKAIQDSGLGYGWHNHAFEFTDLGGEDLPMDLIVAGSDDLKVELDVAWVQVGGQNPLDWIEKLKDRITAAHIKDIAPQGECEDEDGWADVGHGIMDWRAITAALDAAGTRYFIMEHDNPSDDERFARRSLAAANAF